MDESHSVRRKSVKRRAAAVYTSEEEEEEEADQTPPPPPQKKTRYDAYDENDVNVDGSESEEGPSRSFPSPTQKLSNKKGSGSSKVHPSKKRRMVEESDDEFEVDVVSDDLNLEQADDYEDDQDFVEDLPKKAKGKVAAKGKGEKGKTKARHTIEEKEIIVRDERKGAASSGKIRIKPSQHADNASVEESAVDSAPDTGKSDAAPQKRQKLPTIKKNKILTSSAPSAAAKSAPPTAKTSTDGASATPSTPATRVPANLQGADFNLQDRSVYDSIFKNKSGGASRSGNSRENEERRKYLDNLREADKAKRALDAKHTFDLQAQMDKISAFEDRLRRAYSSVLYPNILGAKMREVYEQERRRREPQEEGETS